VAHLRLEPVVDKLLADFEIMRAEAHVEGHALTAQGASPRTRRPEDQRAFRPHRQDDRHGMLVEFPSVVDAVRCATEVQRAMIDREAGMPEDRRIRFRVGINLGDVIVEDEDIFGDGVNVAARLEALSDPGGLCISRMVRDQIRDKLPYAFEDRGEQCVKNIARPVRVYALRPKAVADLPTPSVVPTPPIFQPAVAPRLSIVVLPFANLGNDPEQRYFADGIAEDLTTDLSRIADMFVISRNTAFTYQDKRVDTKQIGRELGVRYVLEGSVRRSGNQVRVNAQLIDAATDAHLWAERFDGDVTNLFPLQDEITSRIAVALNLELVAAEADRPTEHPDALEYILRGRAASNKPQTRDTRAEAISMFERALALDPHSVEAQSRLAGTLAGRAMDGMADSAAADIARSEGLAGRALAASPRSSYVHYAKAQVLRAQAQVLGAQDRCEEAHFRIRDGDRARPQFGVRNSHGRQVQTLGRANRGGDPDRQTSHPP
jgi:TolB-like protein